MKNHVLGAALTGSLALIGLSAHAGCSDPRISAQQDILKPMVPLNLHQGTTVSHWERDDADEKIVGTWHVVYTADGAILPYAQAFIQWHGDRTEWENITMPVLGGNICMGSWKAVDRGHVSRNHVGWLFDGGVISGYFNETETVEVSGDGTLYQGNNDTTGYDLSGKFLFEVKGTSAATRIAP